MGIFISAILKAVVSITFVLISTAILLMMVA